MTRYIGCMELSLLDKLLNKIIINQYTGCWEWQASTNNIGYGMIRDGKKMRTAHRVSYEEHNNIRIPNHLVVMHSCDNPKCINPQHLSLGTRSDNTKDMISKGRGKIFGMIGKTQPRTICVHCNRSIPNNVFNRFHGNNCKLKV
jgi:hypothetical protein